MSEFLRGIVSSYTIQIVALGAAVLGITSGTLGSYAVLRRQALLGDAMSHAALPGIVIAYLLLGTRELAVLLLGAAVAGWLAALLMITIIRHSRIKEDTALGMLLSVFFGFGLVLLAFAQKQPSAAQAGLTKFLFGQAASVVQRDVLTMAVIGGLAIGLMLLFWKEFKLLSFDPEYAAILGLPVRLLDIGLTSLIVVAIVVGLQMVGVVLMSAMLVAPAVAARQWTDRFGVMVVLTGSFGAVAGVAGAVLSATARGLATGPMIVLCISTIVTVSLLFAPNRGVVWNWFQHQRNRRRLRAALAQGEFPDTGRTVEPRLPEQPGVQG